MSVLLLAGCATGAGRDPNDGGSVGHDTDGTTAASSSSGLAEATTADTAAEATITAAVDDTTTTTTTGETDEPPPGCDTPWRVTRTEGSLQDVVLDSTTERLYAVGDLPSGEGWAMAIDACDGTVLVDVSVEHGPAVSTTLSGVALADGDVLVSGTAVLVSDRRNGLYGRLDPDDLTTIWTAALVGSADQDEVIDLTVSTDGAPWMAGTAGYDAMATAWVVRGTPSGQNPCGFAWNGAGSGSARAIAADGDALVVAVRTTDGTLVLARYDMACTCMCAPTWESAPIMVGDQDTSVGELLVRDGQYYVVGWGIDAAAPTDFYPYLLWVSSMGVVIESYTTDFTDQGDGFLIAGADDERLFLGGAEGYSAATGFMNATAVLQAHELPLAGGSQPTWEVRPVDLANINSIAVEPAPDGHLYLGGNFESDGAIVRCDKQGDCD